LLVVAIMSAGLFYTLGVVYPLVNPYKSARYLSQEIVSRIKPGERLGYLGTNMTAPFNFYTGIVPIVELEKKEDLERFLQSPERVYCLLRYKETCSPPERAGNPKMELIARRGVGSRIWFSFQTGNPARGVAKRLAVSAACRGQALKFSNPLAHLVKPFPTFLS